MSLRAWWQKAVSDYAQAAKEARERAAREVEEERARAAWRCKHCGDPAGHWRGGQSERDPGSCEMCERIRHMHAQERRKRIAELAAMVAGRNVQHSLRGGVDAQMTAEVAWEVAEALFRKECGR